MSKAIIDLYVKPGDLIKTLEIIFDNGYQYVDISLEKAYAVGPQDGAWFETRYHIVSHIGKPTTNDMVLD